MRPTHHRRLVTLVGVAFSAVSLIVLAQYAHAAWVDPITSPPGGNTSAPINVSSVAQTKSGKLTVGDLSITGTGDLLLVQPNNGLYWQSIAGTSPNVSFSGNTLTLTAGTAGGGSNNKVDIGNGNQICLNGACITNWPSGGAGSGVSSIKIGANTLTGDVTFQGNSDIGVVNAGNTVNLTCPGCSGGGLWTSNGGFVYPVTATNGLLIGGSGTSSAKYDFELGANPLARFTSRLIVEGGVGSLATPTFKVQNTSGVSTVLDHDVRIVEGELKVDTYDSGSNVTYGTHIKNGSRADIQSFCEGANCNAGFNDSLYLQNNKRSIFISPDSGSDTDPGHIGIGTTGVDTNYKLTIGSGKVNANSLLVRGKVDIVDELFPESGAGDLTVQGKVTADELCLDEGCFSSWAALFAAFP